MPTSLIFERVHQGHLEMLAAQFERVVCIALDVLPRDLALPRARVVVVEALGVAAGTQTLEQVETRVYEECRVSGSDAVKVKAKNSAVVVHSLSELSLCFGKNETLRFLRRLAKGLANASSEHHSPAVWTIVGVVHEPLHCERDLHFWRDYADFIYSADPLTGITKPHAAKKPAVHFKTALGGASAGGFAGGGESGGQGPSPSPSPSNASGITRLGNNTVVVNSTNPEDYEDDDDDDPDDDLDL